LIRVPRRYVATEKLEGENQYDAVEHGKQDAEKGVSFVSFPPVLNLQLKRFDFDMATGDMVKVRRSSPPRETPRLAVGTQPRPRFISCARLRAPAPPRSTTGLSFPSVWT